jgi:hypothetical protein
MKPAPPALVLPEVPVAPPPRGALLYVLMEPDNTLICYVGQTRQPRTRLLGHIRNGRLWLADLARRRDREQPQLPLPLGEREGCVERRACPPREPVVLEEWLARLLAEDKVPRMRCIESVACERRCGCSFVADCRQARLREAWWIERLIKTGHPLLNRTVPRSRD